MEYHHGRLNNMLGKAIYLMVPISQNSPKPGHIGVSFLFRFALYTEGILSEKGEHRKGQMTSSGPCLLLHFYIVSGF